MNVVIDEKTATTPVAHRSTFWRHARERLTTTENGTNQIMLEVDRNSTVDEDEESLPADEYSIHHSPKETAENANGHFSVWRRKRPRSEQSPTMRPNTACCTRRLVLTSLVSLVAAGIAAWTYYPAARYALRWAVTGQALPTRHVAFIGNSILYFYDLPRMLSIASDQAVQQNSVLAGAGSLANMATKQNGMWNRWRTTSALLYELEEDDDDNQEEQNGFADTKVWDFGACTMEMLLVTGHNVEQAQADHDEWWEYRETYQIADDDAWTAGGGGRDPRQTNPCMQSQAYLDFLANLPVDDIRRSVPGGGWDFVVLDDRTAGARTQENREVGLAALEETFLPLFQASGVTPIFLVTSAYWTHRNDQYDDDVAAAAAAGNTNTLENIPYWTVQTYEGYKQYANYLRQVLPYSQRPRLVNMGMAFLVVLEENLDLWYKLYWVDNKHQSPHGSFLQTCLLHHAVYGVLPRRSVVLRDDMESLWDETRTLMYPRDTVVDFPTRDEAEYLYDVCRRVANGYLPPSFQREMETYGFSLY